MTVLSDRALQWSIRGALEARAAVTRVNDACRNDRGEVNMIFLIVAAVIVLVGLVFAWTTIIQPLMKTASDCAEALNNIDPLKPDTKCE